MPVASSQPVYPPPAGLALEAPWGQAVAEHVVQRFASVTARNTLWTSPPAGAVCTTTDLDQMWLYDGAAWVEIAKLAGVTASLALKANLAGATFTGAVSGVTPTAVAHFTRKDYVDNAINGRVAVAGDVMTGFLTLHSSAPTNDLHAASRGYVVAQRDSRVATAGDTMTGMLTLPGTTPSSANHATRKGYVDSQDALRVAATGDVMTGNLQIGGNYVSDVAGITLTPQGGIRTNNQTSESSNISLYRTAAASIDSGEPFIYLVRAGNIIGSATITAGLNGVSWATSSDYRLKDDNGLISGAEALAIVRGLRPKNLRWKDTGAEFVGFIAHEFAEQIPWGVSGEKDAMYSDDHPEETLRGKPRIQQLDNSHALPFLTASVQYLADRLDSVAPESMYLEDDSDADVRDFVRVGDVESPDKAIAKLGKSVFLGRRRGAAEGMDIPILTAVDAKPIVPHAVFGEVGGPDRQRVGGALIVPLMLAAFSRIEERVSTLENRS